MDTSVSYHTIMPPSWCSLPSDRELYRRPRPMEVPEIIELKDDSRCACGTIYDPALPKFRAPCLIYGLSRTMMTEIELQHCRTCSPRRRQSIGPDARELGLFNWNNHLLFTHDLLDEYTCAYCTSETPFAAWVLVTSSRYNTYQSTHAFVSVGLFRSAWFTFVQLQDFGDDMVCTICGPDPETVIWDGVTVAFSKKKLLPSLQPPTTIFTNSPVRGNVRYYPAQQLIPQRETRQLVRTVLTSYEQMRREKENGGSIAEGVEHGATVHGPNHTEVMILAEERLKTLNSGLGVVFAQTIGSESGSAIPSPAFLELFRQVSLDRMTYLISTTDLDRFLLMIPCCASGQATR